MVAHMKFDPALGSQEGLQYFGAAYKPNQDVYVNVKDPELKNRILKISKPEGYVDPNEIDPLRVPGAFVGDDGKVVVPKDAS